MQEHLEREPKDERLQRVADLLLEGHAPDLELPDGLVVSDLEATLRIFLLDSLYLKGMEYFPAITSEADGPVPVSLRALLGASWQPGVWTQRNMDRSRIYRRVEAAMSAARDRGQIPLQRISHRQAFDLVKDRLFSFLQFRLRAVKSVLDNDTHVRGDWRPITLLQAGGLRSVTTPGCQFKVETRSGGLTVYWSPAFFIAPNFFGAPSSPVINTLQAGIYRFGISHTQGGPQWDHDAVVSIPHDNSVYLQF